MGLIKSIWDGYVKVDEFVGDLIVSTTDHVGHKIGEFLGEDKKDVKTEVRKKTNSQVAVVNHQKGGQSRKRTLPQASVANYPKIEQRRKSQAVENASDYTKNSAFNQDNSESAVLPIKQIEQQPSVVLSDAEEKYKEKVLCYIDNNGIIKEGERSLLELKRIKYGLSEEQAAKVEELCKRLNG